MADRRRPRPLAAHDLDLPGWHSSRHCRRLHRTNPDGSSRYKMSGLSQNFLPRRAISYAKYNARPVTTNDPALMPATADHFYSGALGRIRLFMIALAAPLIASAWWKFGLRPAAGLVFGCLIAYINFYWLKRVISGFVDHAAGAADLSIPRRNRLPLPAALCFDGHWGICYIDCFTREPEWASCGLIFARSGHRLRSSLRTLRSPGPRNLEVTADKPSASASYA